MPDADSGDLLLVAAQDATAFQRLLDRWRRPVYAIFERTREPSAATETAGHVFVALYRSAGSYAVDIPFPVWLFGLVARQIQNEPPQPLVSIPPQRLTESQAAQTAYIRSAIAALPPNERAALLLTRIGRLPLPVVAKAANISEADLRKRLVNAMETLTASLEPLLQSQGLSATRAVGETGGTP